MHSKLDALIMEMRELKETNTQILRDNDSKDRKYMELFGIVKDSLSVGTDKQQEIQYDITDIRIQQENLVKAFKQMEHRPQQTKGNNDDGGDHLDVDI